MSLNKRLFISLVSLLAVAFAVPAGTVDAVVWADSETENPSRPDTLEKNPLLIAEAGAGEDKGTGKASGPDESGTKTAPKKNESSSRSKSKPSKRFVPSEKIRAEQGVDFPHDI